MTTPTETKPGFWAPRNRLKIFAGLSVYNSLMIGWQLFSFDTKVPLGINLTMLVSNLVLAMLLWMFATAPRPSSLLVWATVAAMAARIAIGVVSLAYVNPDPFTLALLLAGSVAVAAYVWVTIQAIRRESEPAAEAP